MSSRAAATVALVVLAGGLAAAIMFTTPWRTLDNPTGGATRPSVSRDFTPAQIHREQAFHRAIRPASYAGLAVSLGAAVLLGLTPLGARLIGALARPLGGRWWWQVALGSLAVALIGQLVTLPFSAYAEAVLRRYGLSTQDWGGWVLDLLKGFGIGRASCRERVSYHV